MQSVTVGFVSLIAELDFKFQNAAESQIISFCGIPFNFVKKHSLLQLLHEFVSVFPQAFCEVTAFLGDGIIFILFLVQRKSVVYRTEWTEARKARQRFWWSFRTAEHVKTRLTCKGLHMFSLFWSRKIILRYGYVMFTYAHIKSHQQISHSFCAYLEVSTLLLPIAFVVPARRIRAFWVISILYTSFCNIYAWLFLANVREVQCVSVQKGWEGFWQ